MQQDWNGGADAVDALPSDLAHEPRLLVDAVLLGALHAELHERQGSDERARTLFQMGFLHGLRDALAAAAVLGDDARPGPAPTPAAPLLEMALDVGPRGTPRGDVALVGRWPQAHEAAARRARLGASHGPSCGLSAGYTAGWYSGLLERDLVAVERSCIGAGDLACRFELRDASAWAERNDPTADALLLDLPFQALHEIARRSLTAPATAVHAPRANRSGAPGSLGASLPPVDAPTPYVHVWGPVMVIPFSDTDEALRGLALIGRDPAARNVSVVIVDLRDAVLDEAFGAAALEHVVGAIEGWGAEPILAGGSSLADAAIAELVARHVILHKDLPEAIAAAFEIVRLQGGTV